MVERRGWDVICKPLYLSGSWREVLERPPGPLFFLRLLDLLGDLHGCYGGLKKRKGRRTEERVIYVGLR